MKILSLGWGVQSFTLAAMVALGDLEPVDFAIHADTGYESELTYQFISRWEAWFKDHNFQIFTVKNSSSRLGEDGVVDIPAFTVSDKGDGQIRRQCTQNWKINYMRRAIRKYLRCQGIITRPPVGIVEQWIGISLEEFQRMKDSDVKYITNRWPLIEKRMTRKDCVTWLRDHHLEIPPKSACTFCPFHSTAEWRRIKANAHDWQEAVAVDNAIRKARPPYDLYVHPARKPLETIDFRTPEEKGQLSLWNNECFGICGL